MESVSVTVPLVSDGTGMVLTAAVQLLTALIGGAVALLIFPVLRKALPTAIPVSCIPIRSKILS